MKDFLLIGNKNCIAHKDFFKLMMDRRVNIELFLDINNKGPHRIVRARHHYKL